MTDYGNPEVQPTARQLEVLLATAQYGSLKEAGYRLGISPSTAKAHLEKLRYRLGADSTAQAVYIAMLAGLIQ